VSVTVGKFIEGNESSMRDAMTPALVVRARNINIAVGGKHGKDRKNKGN